jgi:phospholipase C
VPYELDAEGTVDRSPGAFRIDFANTGKAGVCFQVFSGNPADLPRTYTVEPRKSLFDSWTTAGGRYDLSAFGPNGFLRAFRGAVAGVELRVESRYQADAKAIGLVITNFGRVTCQITVQNAYGDEGPVTRRLRPGQSDRQEWHLKGTHGWYDLTIVTDADPGFLRRLAGHVEDGDDSVSDPAFGA